MIQSSIPEFATSGSGSPPSGLHVHQRTAVALNSVTFLEATCDAAVRLVTGWLMARHAVAIVTSELITIAQKANRNRFTAHSTKGAPCECVKIDSRIGIYWLASSFREIIGTQQR